MSALPEPTHRGKVRDVYDVGEHLILVATDRVSAFDVILNEPIPDKGKILSSLSAFWFEATASTVPHHVVSTSLSDFPEPFASCDELDGRSMLVRKAKRVDVECVVRGYLAGSGFADYRKTGQLFGNDLPAGLPKGAKLAEPVFTPTTKAAQGHDEPMTFEEVVELVGEPLAHQLREISLTLYAKGREVAEEAGFLLADTKFEFGHVDGQLTVIDELLTPDSSRYWRVADYREGEPPESWDKQIVRDYLETLDWNKEPPAPPLPSDIIRQARERYLDVHRAITGNELRLG